MINTAELSAYLIPNIGKDFKAKCLFKCWFCMSGFVLYELCLFYCSTFLLDVQMKGYERNCMAT